MKFEVVDAVISPKGQLETLSQFEVVRILNTSYGELNQIFRNCSLAVLNSGASWYSHTFTHYGFIVAD